MFKNNKVTFWAFLACITWISCNNLNLSSLYDIFVKQAWFNVLKWWPSYKMAAILDNMPIYMWCQIITNVLLLKKTLPLALNISLLQNDIQLSRLYMKTGRHFKIQDGGCQGAFLAWHWPSKILLITNLAMYKVSCFYHKMHNFFTYLPHYKGVICNMTSSSNSSQSTFPTGRVLGNNYSTFLDFTLNYEQTSGIFVPWKYIYTL